MSEKTPEQERSDNRCALSRLLVGWLHDLDLTQAQLADLIGVSAQKVQRWTDHRNPEVPGLSDIKLFPRELARLALTWLAEGHHVAIVDELAPAETARDHLAEIQRLAAADADVVTSYAGALADGMRDASVRRELIKKLRRSIEIEHAILRRLEGETAADRSVFKGAAS